MNEHFFPGRPKSSTRSVTDECLVLSIRAFKRDGVLEKGSNQTWSSEWKNRNGEVTSRLSFQVVAGSLSNFALIFDYTLTDPSNGAKIPTNFRVELVATPCRFGGRRYWFVCPLITNSSPCRRRVGCLFLPPGGRYFGCRHCYNLTYRCQKEHNKELDALMKLPLDELARQMDPSKGISRSLRALEAGFRHMQRLERLTKR